MLTQARIRNLWKADTNEWEFICLERDWPAISKYSEDTPQVPLLSKHLAYVIYTSGSTGKPKGVAIEHHSAVNTIVDINQRFEVTAADTVLALSALNFDLSVYDIFGLLAAGGTVVMVADEDHRDPKRWLHLMQKHQVTVWDTVPALMQMLVDHKTGLNRADSLRLVLLSGDWLPLTLPDAIRSSWPKAEVISSRRRYRGVDMVDLLPY